LILLYLNDCGFRSGFVEGLFLSVMCVGCHRVPL